MRLLSLTIAMVAIACSLPANAQTAPSPSPSPSAAPSAAPAPSAKPRLFAPGAQFVSPGISTATAFDLWQSGETTIAGRFHVGSFGDIRYTENTSGGGIGLAQHVYAGLTIYHRDANGGVPALNGIGFTVMLAPNPNARIAPYGWYTYVPADRESLYRAGLALREPGTRWYFDAGWIGETLRYPTLGAAASRPPAFRFGIGYQY